jgi:hypothetical protein
MTLWLWSRIFNAPIDRVVDPAALLTIDVLANECIESIFDIMERRQMSRPLAERVLSGANFYTVEPWRRLMASNSPGTLPPRIPLLLAQGGADQLVRPRVTEDCMKRQCRAGGNV